MLYPTRICNRWERKLQSKTLRPVNSWRNPPARTKGSGGKVGRVATGTAVGAGAGAASGALGSVIYGASAGLGSMVGAASGAVWGLLTGLFSAVVGPSSQPSQAYTNYVNRCLQEKGYEVTGWQ